MRLTGGRPSPGMYARLLEPEDCLDQNFVFLLQRKDAQQYLAQFRFIVASSFELQERRERGLKILASTYYQNSPMFLPLITATFARDSRLAELLLRAGKARFACSEGAHSFVWQTLVEEALVKEALVEEALDEEGYEESRDGSDLYEASLAHNRLFAVQAPQRVLVFHAEKITRQAIESSQPHVKRRTVRTKTPH